MTTLLLVTACPPAGDGDSDPSTGTTEPGTASVGETGAPETGSATDPAPTTSATDPDATAGATDPGPPETTTATDGMPGETDTEGDDTGQASPEQCVTTDPAVSAAFALDLTGWPLDPELHAFTAPCTVGAVTAAGDTVSTELACEFEGQPQAAILGVAAAPEGAVDWAAGDTVILQSEVGGDGLEGASWRWVRLRGGDESLLMSGDESSYSDNVYSRFAPVAVALVRACGEQPEMPFTQPMRADFTPPDGPVVGIFHGHRGVVPVSAGTTFAIDVERALGDDIHPDADIKILLRRVKTGG